MIESVLEVLRLLLGGDAELWRIIALSLRVSGLALLFSTLLGIPLGAFLGLRTFAGRRNCSHNCLIWCRFSGP